MFKRMTFMAVALLVLAGAAQAQLLTTLYDINQGLVPGGTQVRVENIVVTAVAYNGFYAQELGGGAYSGAWIYTSSAEPPDAGLAGQIVSIEGNYTEYFNLTEIIVNAGTSGVIEIVDAGDNMPAPQLVTAEEANTAHPLVAEQWEGVLVTCDNLQAIDLDPGFGEWFAAEFVVVAALDTMRLDDQFGVTKPPAGTQMSSVTGILNYTFSDFKLEPRFADDIQYIGAAPAPKLVWACATGASTINLRFDRAVETFSAQSVGNYYLDIGTISTVVQDAEDLQLVHITLVAPMTPAVLLTLTVFGVQNQDNIPMSPEDIEFWGGINSIPFVQQPDAAGDSSAIAGSFVTITGVVHSKYDVFGSHVYLQDVNRSDFNGIEIYMSSLLPSVEVGDILVIGDQLSEYFNMTSMTQPYLYFENVSSGNTVLGPEVIPVVEPVRSNYEKYEGALVRVESVVCVERAGGWNFFDWSVTQDNLNWLKIGDRGDYDYQSSLGDTLNITGTLVYEFSEYKIMPRSDADIEVIYSNPIAVPGMPAGAATALGQNFPNPFNPVTKIAFRLGAPGAAELTVFDPQGRVVKSLHTGELGMGDHQVTWEGDTDNGGLASSGVYFYRLQTSEGSFTKRMVLLK